jgi:hypothetical protein
MSREELLKALRCVYADAVVDAAVDRLLAAENGSAPAGSSRRGAETHHQDRNHGDINPPAHPNAT